MKTKFRIIAAAIVSVILLDLFVLALPSLTKPACAIVAGKTNCLQKNVKAGVNQVIPVLTKLVQVYRVSR